MIASEKLVVINKIKHSMIIIEQEFQKNYIKR